MISPIDRVILIDILKNPGSTRDQVRYRLSGHSPVTINRIIERLIDKHLVSYSGTIRKLEINQAGLNSLYVHRKGVVSA